MVGTLISRLATADLTALGWAGLLAAIGLAGLFELVREWSRRLTLKAAVKHASPGMFLLDRRRGRTLMIITSSENPRSAAEVSLRRLR